MKPLDHYWYSQNPIAWLLLPLALLFWFIVSIRRLLYLRGFLKQTKVKVPVIIVGNIAVGGTGKTPLIIALCQQLQSLGYHPGIISRGYGGRYQGVREVSSNDSTDTIGDEPLMLKQHLDVPVVVSRDRVAAAHYLLQQHNCQLILSDDGLQHYALQRDLELVVIDTERMHGNGWMLPAGPLREPKSRLNTVDQVIYHGSVSEKYRFELEIDEVDNIKSGETKALVEFSHTPVHAIAGIGHPQRFFNLLKSHGLDVIEHPFPDHHPYTKEEIDFKSVPILMTEKDAVKCNQMEIDDAWCVKVKATLSAELVQYISDAVERLLHE